MFQIRMTVTYITWKPTKYASAQTNWSSWQSQSPFPCSNSSLSHWQPDTFLRHHQHKVLSLLTIGHTISDVIDDLPRFTYLVMTSESRQYFFLQNNIYERTLWNVLECIFKQKDWLCCEVDKILIVQMYSVSCTCRYKDPSCSNSILYQIALNTW